MVKVICKNNFQAKSSESNQEQYYLNDDPTNFIGLIPTPNIRALAPRTLSICKAPFVPYYIKATATDNGRGNTVEQKVQ